MSDLHLTEYDLAQSLARVLEEVSRGHEVVVERDSRPVAVIRPAEEMKAAGGRTGGADPMFDMDYGEGCEMVVFGRRPWTRGR